MNKENFILTPNSYTQEEWCEMYAKMVKYAQKLNNAIKEVRELVKTRTKLIPFDENGEGGGLELTDYDIKELLEILEKEVN